MTQYRTRLVGRTIYLSRPATKAESEALGGVEAIVVPSEIPAGVQPNLRNNAVAAQVQAMKDGFDELVAQQIADRLEQ